MCLPIKRFFRNVARVVRWIPVIWRDCDFDSAYLYRIINFKLLSMERFFESDKAMAVHTKKELRKLKVARILTDRLGNDKLYLPIREWCERDDTPPITGVPKKEPARCLARMRHHEYMRQQDKDVLFHYMRKHIDGWWD